METSPPIVLISYRQPKRSRKFRNKLEKSEPVLQMEKHEQRSRNQKVNSSGDNAEESLEAVLASSHHSSINLPSNPHTPTPSPPSASSHPQYPHQLPSPTHEPPSQSPPSPHIAPPIHILHPRIPIPLLAALKQLRRPLTCPTPHGQRITLTDTLPTPTPPHAP